ncbi:serine phosphatase RsbU (regulator of sigma subunit) [Isoptericola sp. CG 20/1183]|uniref:Serine phosphatase RsbU (Regulator of sigma subunit) n=1 Tax=Isoptericola halotolerans TaxID=300560 RepID=A0ABX5ECN3_9MICO|nr:MULTISPECIES: SpoIIE family protein phosphatase [Isoptericola]PRZ05596.1 serine phosphatase RsbU (regulator of sigma subunit) [Isoptericola halotolerans]PRZ06164.1 serine phosphatase RsbU (regulator of sigma subunit) [Isoptericola sp. CG 20/1183]
MISGDGGRAGSEGGASAEPTVVLLVEDDDGDALLVTELLADAEIEIEVRRATSVAQAADELAQSAVDCLIVDLGLPDAVGLGAVERLRRSTERHPVPPALVVLTGHAGIDQGVRAVAAGADDYLVKGETGPDLLGRSLRYALQRRRSAAQQRALYRSEVRAAETARLERALLPKPLVEDVAVSVMVGYLPGGNGLLGGDFFDSVEMADGTVLSMVGDVAGHGPDEAALGATLRTAWRTLVLTGTPPVDVLGHLERVLVTERSRPETFVTLCQVAVAADRGAIDLYLAGHPAPMLLTGPVGAVRCDQVDPTSRGRALGIPIDGGWVPQRLEVDGPFAVLMYTDGLVEASVADPVGGPAGPAGPGGPGRPGGRGPERIGVDGLHRLVQLELDESGFVGVVERVLRRVRAVHGGPLVDDAAMLVIGWTGTSEVVGERSSTLADSAEWARW